MTDHKTLTMDQATAFKYFKGEVCCFCLVAITDENKVELGNADWCADYDVFPCEACWTKSETERDGNKDGLAPVSMAVFDAIAELAFVFEEAFRAAMGYDA